MVQTAKKWLQIAHQLNDWFVEISEFELNRIIRDCRQWLRTADTHDAAEVYDVMGVAHTRLHKLEDALTCHLNVDRLTRSSSATCKRNVGAALIALDRPQEAIGWFIEALELDDSHPASVYANLAEACMLAGLPMDAQEAFRDAVMTADHTNPGEVFMLATQAAELGADRDALELYARSLALRQRVQVGSMGPLDIIKRAPDDIKSGLRHFRSLNAVVGRAEAFGTMLRHFVSTEGPVSIDSTGDTDMDTFEATKPYRTRAMAAALAMDDDA